MASNSIAQLVNVTDSVVSQGLRNELMLPDLSMEPAQGTMIAEAEVVAEGALLHQGSLAQVIHHLPASNSSVLLKQREEIARAAFKTWFRVKPGHKEIKDHWWALYYKKILPRFHLRDNHLGRKINSWIEEDLRAVSPLPSKMTDDGEEEVPTAKKKKANSSKEGTMPAYVNVELVHPPKLAPEQMPSHMLKLASCVVNGDIDWTNEELEEDILWFKVNRQKLMEAIPPVSMRTKRTSIAKRLPNPFSDPYSRKKQKSPEHSLTSIEEVHESLDPQPYCVCNASWVRYDLLKSEEAYWLKVDLPGMAGHDFSVQTDDINKLVVKGERKLDPEMQQEPAAEFLMQRSFGHFEIELIMPMAVDLAKTEQDFRNGVLTVKCPIKDNQWRNIGEEIVELTT